MYCSMNIVLECIIHKVTSLYSPESNEVVERKNKTFKELMNVIFISSSARDITFG